MKHIIVGTAGHIDHGKTTLIKALTGRNTDRWKEEQERGITIDLGFTWFDMKNGDRVGIIDVPGHERFIANMVAGVVGMDLVILVVAADEGIMPQTREHMDILGLLGIEKSIVVLNKCDLVDEDWLELVEEEVREELEGTFLEHAPIIPVSSVTGFGLDALQDEIIKMTREEVKEKNVNTIPRLPIDRVFTIAGFGTVITGTLISGSIGKDDVLEMYPIGKECKIRNIQVHGKDTERCYAGQRVAINIPNLKKSEIKRGCVIAPPNNMKNTDRLDVKINLLDSTERILKNHSRVHFFSGTSEIICRCNLLDADELGPGESGYAQLVLEQETALKRGDRFVIRFYSPMETIGGGVILESNPKKKKRYHEDVLEEMRQKEHGTLADVMEIHVKKYGETMVTLAEVAKLMAHSPAELNEYLPELGESVLFFPMKKDIFLWHKEAEYVLRQKILADLTGYQSQYPYRYGKKKAEIRTTYLKKMKPNVFDAYIEWAESQGILGRKEEYLFTPGYEVVKDARYQSVEKTILAGLKKAGYDFIRLAEIDFHGQDPVVVDDVLQMLILEGTVMRLTEDTFTLTDLILGAADVIKDMLGKAPVITFGDVRDALGNSRKNAKLVIEYTDHQKITKKVGGETERVAY
ncbi:MAG: selenocysteine-specific translation elongation factor [Dorea sp.]|nr:selenocysteine-specific translation elongation factor [Dorea sp.]